MKPTLKHGLKKSLHVLKKLANTNKYTKKAAQKAKRIVISAIGQSEQQELYNLSSFYPTINEYYAQQHDQVVQNGPLISILLPTYNTPELYLRECIESILIQSYANWELCIADDNSTDKNVITVIKGYIANDDRIKLVQRKANGHISLASNSALSMAAGEFVGLMDHDDVLWPNALYEVVKVLQADRRADFIYSDEDKIDSSGKVHSYPFLKPDFSPEFLESCNYITHFSCIRKTLVDEVGGFRKGYEGAQDWDIFLRISQISQHIIHIPKLLYSWRIHAGSTASDTDAKPYVYEAQLKLLTDHLKRTGRTGQIETGIITQHRTIKYDVVGSPDVAVVILYSDTSSTRRLLDSLVAHPAGLPFHVVLVHNNEVTDDVEASIKALYPRLKLHFVHLSLVDGKQYYASVIKHTDAEYFIFASSAVEINSRDWAARLIADCQLRGVGVVGPILLDATSKIVRSAGQGIGYGPNGHADMLRDMPFDDPHYSRGLYAKSRRNVSAVNGALFAISRDLISAASNATSTYELCVRLLDKNFRHVYTPYVQAILHEDKTSIPSKHDLSLKAEDRYLNPNFNHANQRMEVRA